MRCKAGPSTSDPKRSRTPDGSSTSITARQQADEETAAAVAMAAAAGSAQRGHGKPLGASGLISTAAKLAIAARSICLRHV